MKIEKKRKMIKLKGKKRGISPVIATVLLIAMVVVIGLIIFLWFRGLTEEAVTKFGGTNIQLVCEDVQFSSSYSGGILFLSNTGNVPIYSVKLRITREGGYQTIDLMEESSNWPDTGLGQGGTYSSNDLSSSVSGADEVLVIPVLLGTSDRGERTYTCDEQYGQIVV